MSLRRWSLLLWSNFGRDNCSNSTDGEWWGAATGWEQFDRTAGLASYPSKAEDRFCICPDSLVRLTTWLGLSTIFSSRRSYEVASLPWQGSRVGHSACTANCLGIWIRPECALNPLVRCGHWFCSADEESHSLCSLFKCHSTRGLLNGLCTFLCALVSFPGQTGWGCILWWAWLWIRFLAQAQREKQLESW